MLVRPLLAQEVPSASEMLVLTNDGVSAPALAEDLEECRAKWPLLQLGAFQKEGTHLVGVIAGRIDASDATLGWSDDIVLLQTHRGLGTGSRLLEEQLNGFRALGCKRVRGRSPKRLMGAVPFFVRHGFRVVDETVSQGTWGIQDGEPLSITERIL
jgi:GNAT superfamily N-acetyltransferase